MCSAPSAPRPACPPSVCRAASRPRVCRWGCNSWGGRGTRTSCSPRRARGRRRRHTIDSARRCRKIDATMTWQSEMDELRRRESLAEELGGPERVKRQHAGGRMTIRERIAKLVDAGTFHEVGKIAGKATYDAANDLETFTPSNFVFGRAKVDGRPVVVGGDDFTVRGGSADATIKEKHLQCETMAHELRLPLIRLVEGSGGGGSVKTIETTGRANVPGVSGWEWVVANIGTVPRVALGLGSVAGLGAAHLAAAHYSVMIKDLSALFVAGPPVVERLGQKLTKNELGGWEIQLKAGAVDDAVDTEEEAFARVRGFLSYLPSSIDEVAPRGPRDDDPARRVDWLMDAIPRDIRKPYKMRPIVEAVVDAGSFFEIAPLYGCSVIVRNCFGVAGAAHRNGGRYCTRYAWPSGRWGSLPLEGGIEAAYRAEIDAAPDPRVKMAEIEERLTKLRSPFRSAETFWIEEIVDPRDTRRLLCEWAELAAPRRRPGPSEHRMRP